MDEVTDLAQLLGQRSRTLLGIPQQGTVAAGEALLWAAAELLALIRRRRTFH
jgi:hypothetical protein